MGDHMELIEEDAGLRHMLHRGVTKGLPDVHDRQINAPAFLDSQFREEQAKACSGWPPRVRSWVQSSCGPSVASSRLGKLARQMLTAR